ncbi:MAG TPA: helix-turn-helix domain-containing protein [Coleofasciculaceae cyanobacterium]
MSVTCVSGPNVSSHRVFPGYTIANDRGVPRFFPPQVALYSVKLACELPETCGRSLSQWDCTELASQLVAAGVVNSISPSTIKRILIGHRLKSKATSSVVIPLSFHEMLLLPNPFERFHHCTLAH